MNTTHATKARQPKNRLALVSLVAALYAPVAVPLAFLLDQLALASAPRVCQSGAPGCCPLGVERCFLPEPPVTQRLFDLSFGLLILIIPAVGVAIISGHIALSRLRYQSAPKYRRNVVLWSLILGYITLPVVVALWFWAAYTGALGGD